MMDINIYLYIYCSIEDGNGGTTKAKDVFIFSPIFETVEEAVQVGIGIYSFIVNCEKIKDKLLANKDKNKRID